MATQEKTWNVANRLHSLKDSDNPEVNHIIAGADEIYDDTKGAKQSDINAQTDAALADRYTKSETYSKEQLDSLITTPDANYVSVATFADLPQTGEANTIYRVSSYDGTQVDASKYALYAWNGATYQLLAVRSAVGEVFDVSEYNSGATYETLTAALAAVPASVQKGGMSIKFILRTNTGTEEEPVYHDEYVLYRLMNTDWSTVITDWQGVDKVPTPGSHNFVESGGVQNELALGAIYDVSAKNPTAGPNNDGKFESLSALLSDANLNTLIPTAYRKGGMSIKFVQSSDNNYVLYFLKKNTWSTDVNDWEKINLEDGVRTLEIEVNGGTQQETKQYSEAGYIKYNDGSIVTGNSWIHTPLIPIGNVIQFGKIIGNGSVANVAFYATQELSSYISGLQTLGGLPADADILMSSITPPSGANYIAFSTNGSSYPKIEVVTQTQSSGLINDVEDLKARVGQAEDSLDTIEDTLFDEKTVSTPNNGYIDHSGEIAGTTSTWKHSDIFPVGQFNSATGIIRHGSVSSFAFYVNPTISSANNNFKGYWDLHFPTGYVVDKETFNSHIPTGAKYFVCSTDTASDTLQLKLSLNAIEDLQTSVEQIEGTLETMSGQVETNTDDIADLKSSVRAAVRMLHISFDDTINAFKDLIDNNRTSLFDSPFFGALKTLHDTYGVVFSCYCFYDMIELKYVSKISTITNPSTTSVYYLSATDGTYTSGYYVYRNSQWVSYDESTMRDDYVLFSLSDMTNTYATEFTAAKDWLKFGFHSLDGTILLSYVTAADAKDYYDDFIEDIVRITGTVEVIDMAPRLQSFSGTLDVCRALRDCDCGCLGFLTADYSETSGGSGGQSVGYYLTTPAPVVLWNKGQWYDYQERLHFYPSSLRLDGMTASDTETYMNKFLGISKYGQSEMICMYCHENQMFVNGSVGSNYTASLTKVAEWAVSHGYLFGYPMDRIRAAF